MTLPEMKATSESVVVRMKRVEKRCKGLQLSIIVDELEDRCRNFRMLGMKTYCPEFLTIYKN